MVIMQHRKTTAASMVQNSIPRNAKCDIMVSFSKFNYTYVANYEVDNVDTTVQVRLSQ